MKPVSKRRLRPQQWGVLGVRRDIRRELCLQVCVAEKAEALVNQMHALPRSLTTMCSHACGEGGAVGCGERELLYISLI